MDILQSNYRNIGGFRNEEEEEPKPKKTFGDTLNKIFDTAGRIIGIWELVHKGHIEDANK